MQIGQALVVQSNKTQALDALYEYLCGKEFQHHLANLVEAVVVMKNDLDGERIAKERSWAKRETQLKMLMRSSAGMYGDLEAILGGALQPVAALELSSSKEGDDEPLALAS